MKTQIMNPQKKVAGKVLVGSVTDRKIIYLKDDLPSQSKTIHCVTRPTCPGHCACASK